MTEKKVPSDDTAAPQAELPGKPKPLQPALNQIGTIKCAVCRSQVAVYVTKTNRPFVNCGFCSARIFYNGRESIRLLLRNMRPLSDKDRELFP